LSKLGGGTHRCLKFRIGALGNAAYEALMSDPFCEVTKDHVFNSFEEVFVIVWFIDFGEKPFDPETYLPKRSAKKDVQEGDPDDEKKESPE